MKKPTDEQIKEIHDCSNCRFSSVVSPYKILMKCEKGGKVNNMPYTCDKWASLIWASST